MERDALIVYLRNIRDLEIARWTIVYKTKKLQNEYEEKNRIYSESVDKKTYNEKIEALDNAIEADEQELYKLKQEGEGEANVSWIPIIIAIICIIFLVLVWKELGNINSHDSGLHFSTFLYVVIIALPLTMVVVEATSVLFGKSSSMDDDYKNRVQKRNGRVNSITRDLETKRAERERLKSFLSAELNRTKDFPKHKKKNKDEWNKIRDYLFKEKDKVEKLLEQCYNDANIVPKPHRELASIIFIYDYLSTSQVDFEFVLRSTDIKNAVNEIAQSLDIISCQLNDVVVNTRVTARNTSIIATITATMADMVGYIAGLTDVTSITPYTIATNSKHKVDYSSIVSDNTAQVFDSDIKILKECQEVSRDTKQEAMYNSIISHYLESNDYFQTADYLKL